MRGVVGPVLTGRRQTRLAEPDIHRSQSIWKQNGPVVRSSRLVRADSDGLRLGILLVFSLRGRVATSTTSEVKGRVATSTTSEMKGRVATSTTGKGDRRGCDVCERQL